MMMTKKEKKRVPELRFEGFEGEWEEKKYKDIYFFITTNSYSRSNLNYEDGKVKNIHYGDIHTKFATLFDITKELVPFINSDIDISRYKEENYCKEGDLVIADASEDYDDIGKTIEIVNLNDEKVLAGLHTFLARPKDDRMAIGFSGYMLQSWSVRIQVMTIAQGTKVRGIASGRLGNISLTYPKKDEQQKIALFLTSIDTRIHQLEKKKTLLEQYKKGVMQQLFKQEIRFKDDDGKEFPKWEKKRWGEFLSIPEKITPKKIDKEKILTVKLHLKGVFLNDRTEGLKIGATRYIKRKAGQFIYGKQNLFNGAFGIVQKEFDGFLSSGDVPTLDVNSKVVNAYYFYYFLSRTSYYKSLEKFSSGSGSKRIHEKTLLKLKAKVPCLAEQTKIAHFLSAIDTKIAVVDEQMEKTKEWKKGMLQRMFV